MSELLENEFVEKFNQSKKVKLLLDVRSLEETQAGILKSAVIIPVQELSYRIDELEPQTEVVVRAEEPSLQRTFSKPTDFTARFLQ